MPPIAAVHERMPVMLAAADIPRWLGEDDLAPVEVLPRLVQRRAHEIHFHAVSRRVNAVQNDDPALIEPVIIPTQRSLL